MVSNSPPVKMRIEKFLGEAPKIAPEQLPDNAAQISYNTKFYSGDILPYPLPYIVTNSGLTGVETRTLHGIRDPDTDELFWLAWATDVDVVTAAAFQSGAYDNRGRFYYTGDGVPKVSTFDMATDGPLPWPRDYYELGLPLPETEVTTTAASATSVVTASYARDTGNFATIVTATPHGLRTGNVISITGFAGAGPSSFNATNVEVVVIDDTTISYFNPGDEVTTTSSGAGKVSLSGYTVPRSYVYTWITPWGEESIASDPSETIYIKEGQVVTVSDLPTSKPAGKNFVRGVRLYRTLAAPTGTSYYRLKTLWFPTPLATTARNNGVSTITLQEPHNLIEGDRFLITGATDPAFNGVGEVIEVVDRFTFRYGEPEGVELTGEDGEILLGEDGEVLIGTPDIAAAASTGTLYHDVSESPDDTPRWWGQSSYDFIDDFDPVNLVFPLETDDYDPPPADLKGLAVGPNNMLMGFVGNQLYFSEPDQFHAWPMRYALTFEYEIVGVAAVGGYVLVMTKGYPYRVSGNDPAVMTYSRIDSLYPCTSKRSIVNMGYGVVYATIGGLAMFSPTEGARLVTDAVHHWDTWKDVVDPAAISAGFFKDKYFGSYNEGGFIFERNDQVGGFLTRVQYHFTAAWADPETSRFYYTTGTQGDIYEWDDTTQLMAPMQWKSKRFRTPQYANIGVVRIIADFGVQASDILALLELNLQIRQDNQAVLASIPQLGPVNGYMFNTTTINGDEYMQTPFPIPESEPVVFQLWADGELIFQGNIDDQSIVRLPGGYRADNFEVAVSGSARVKAIHLGETPTGLRTI